MKKLLLVLPLLLVAASARAQSYQVVPTCGAASLTTGSTSGYMDAHGNLCTSGAGGGTSHVIIDGPDGPEGGVSISINPFRENSTNRSGTMTVGGAWQQIAPENLLRQRFFLQNYCSAATQGIVATESVFLAIRTTMPTESPLAGPNGTEIVTCGAYDTSSSIISTAPVWVWAATTNHRFQGLEW